MCCALTSNCLVCSIGNGKCGKSTTNCLHVCPAKLVNVKLRGGICAVQGYIVAIEDTKWGSVIVLSVGAPRALGSCSNNVSILLEPGFKFVQNRSV